MTDIDKSVETTALDQGRNDPDNMVKMVIWDLDETFWSGTLSEEGIAPIQSHIELVKTLSARGIVNSICSKNDFNAARDALAALGVWDQFVFPRIEFAPKGAMVRDIIEAAQLRAPSVLFIDDNPMNLNEALHYSPGLQVAEPGVLASLLEDARCKGKPHPELTRLARYKILEQKFLDQANWGADNTEFLRNSKVRISFHHDIVEQFPRIHDLVNRTNQLNFTKERWPEDEQEALRAYHEDLAGNFESHAGYIKVADRYGSYGICGFYMTRHRVCHHFLFSCRAMNMGVEQFVWQRIGRLPMTIMGEVSSSLGAMPDWITVVDDADATPEASTEVRPVICVRGACDLGMMTHYLRAKYDTIEEFQFPYEGWHIHQVARAVIVADELKTPAAHDLIKKIPGIPEGRFDSAVNTGAADAYVLSFSPEYFPAMYRSKSTGIVLPLAHGAFGAVELSTVDYQKIVEHERGNAGFSAEDWAFMQSEFECLGSLNKELLAADVENMFERLRGKVVIVLILNDSVGGDAAAQRDWILNRFRVINSIVEPLVDKFGFHKVKINEFVRSVQDLTHPTEDPGVHYKREIYMALALRVADICTSHRASGELAH